MTRNGVILSDEKDILAKATRVEHRLNSRGLPKVSSASCRWVGVVLSRRQRVQSMTGALVGTAIVCATVLVSFRPWPHQGSGPAFVFAFATLYTCAEVMVVHVQIRCDSHTFSLSEIPLLLATFLLGPASALAAAVAGNGLALVYRRQKPMKLAFNLARAVIELTISVSVFRALATSGSVPSSRDLAVAYLGTLAASTAGCVLVSAAISLSQGWITMGVLKANLLVSALGTSAAGSLGLLAVVVARTDLKVAWVLALPVAGGYFLSNELVRSRRQTDSLRFLFDAGELLRDNSDLDGMIRTLLERTRDALRCEVAEFVHVVSPAGRCVRASASADGEQRFWITEAEPEVVAVIAGQTSSSVMSVSPGNPLLRCFGEAATSRSGLVARLSADGRSVGMILVSGHVGDVAGAGRLDVEKSRVLGTIAHSLSIALENGALERALDKLRALEDELEYKAYHDSLTGLANRALFVDRLASALTEYRTAGTEFAVLFLDLDDFKTVNDSLGHDTGDALLVAVASDLKSCLAPGDLAARLGGDEFAVLSTAADRLEDAEVLAHSILAVLADPIRVSGYALNVSASIGVALSRPAADVADILKSADIAMYNAKAGGKGRVAVFNPVMQREVLDRYELADGIKRASELGQLRVEFQPVIDLATNAIVSAEILVRWAHPTHGMLGPDSFIHLAEENGAIKQITRFVVDRACELIGSLPRGVLPSIAVNVSAVDLLDTDLLPFLVTTLDANGVEAERLTIEVTESVVLDSRAPGVLGEFRAAGLRVSLDDFGTGYSSLHSLRSLPVHELKIAKPFIDDLITDPHSGEIIRAITTLARTLSLRVVAEGVEHSSQVELLRLLRCDRAQGYLLGRPTPEPAFRALLQCTNALPTSAAPVPT